MKKCRSINNSLRARSIKKILIHLGECAIYPPAIDQSDWPIQTVIVQVYAYLVTDLEVLADHQTLSNHQALEAPWVLSLHSVRIHHFLPEGLAVQALLQRGQKELVGEGEERGEVGMGEGTGRGRRGRGGGGEGKGKGEVRRGRGEGREEGERKGEGGGGREGKGEGGRRRGEMEGRGRGERGRKRGEGERGGGDGERK